MRQRVLSVLLVFVLLSTASAAPLEAEPPFETDCVSAILLEPLSGQIIFEKNADEKRPVASIVKMMTILLALEAFESGRASPEDVVVVSENASGMGGSQVLLDTGEEQKLGTLVKCMIVASANDAAVAVGEHLYGSVKLCVARMNERAEELGMQNTRFVNCTGLPAEGQYTTARDVALLSQELFAHEGYFEYSTIWLDELPHPDGRMTQLTNTNRLIRLYAGCDGGKTGSTNEAGYCISATAQRDGMRLIAVVLGSPTGKVRFSTAQSILDHGFANYTLYPVAQLGAGLVQKLPVTGSALEEIGLRLGKELTLLIEKGEQGQIELRPSLPESVAAPVAEGAVVGSVEIWKDGALVGSVPVEASESADRRSFADGARKVLEKWIYK
ncbi:MAG: D-alanyl-D-alanine carboxypeptidase family protein [Eubacteriales bacterium]|nr:D-alanyl-D-alanine carboxypeptidase family protein [Eubacteriales bacterium]